ncbi:MAG: hypothetical protein QM820_59730 [Minicystis sp.]
MQHRDRKTRRASTRRRVALVAVALSLFMGCDRDGDLLAAHLGQGDKAFAEGRYTEALTAYRHAYDLAPHDPRVQRGTMRARVAVMAETPGRITAESLEDVRYEAQLLLAQDKGREAVALTALANVLARKGDVEGAKAKLAEALKLESDIARCPRGPRLAPDRQQGEPRRGPRRAGAGPQSQA